MDSIEPERLYDEVGTVSWCRPLLQGDIFTEVELPGFPEGPMMIQVINHPCAMRKGPNLLPRITVAPVRPGVSITNWEGHLRVMPLPELRDSKNYATEFVDVTSVSAGALTVDKRIASLSGRGIYVLQQRLIKHYTRLEVDLGTLHQQSAHTLVEAELQQDWLESVLADSDQGDLAAIEAEIRQFDEWMRAGSPSPQDRLARDYEHVDVRREAREAARKRSAVLQASD
ncbi:hypothetical protein [Curtobacterium sp. ME-Dv--P-122a]|uniref:hypothetical protein n=1 Tax=Curtobacterium TaxID=2034 RepID=UPI00254F5181|nr:hypothetical protein [Curtobacterium sp. ME-Dv--P-122a]